MKHDLVAALVNIKGGKKGDLLEAHVGGDIVGGGFAFSGAIHAEGAIKKAVVDGDLIGGTAVRAGLIYAGDGLKELVIAGGIVGGSAYGTGRVEAKGGVGSLEIHGNVRGGTGEYAGSVFTDEKIGTLYVGAGLLGGDYRGTGAIFADKIGTATLVGDFRGGDGEGSAYLQAQKSIGTLFLDGNLIGDKGLRSGSIATFDGKIGKVGYDGVLLSGAGKRFREDFEFHPCAGEDGNRPEEFGGDRVPPALRSASSFWPIFLGFRSVFLGGSKSRGIDSRVFRLTRGCKALRVYLPLLSRQSPYLCHPYLPKVIFLNHWKPVSRLPFIFRMCQMGIRRLWIPRP